MASILVHWGLCVSDIDRSERFYTKAFGFVRDRELRMTSEQIDGLMQLKPKSDIHAVYLMLSGQTLELMHFTGSSATAAKRVFNQTGLTHISIAVEDLPATVALCTELGGQVVSNIGFAAVVRDPDGQILELLSMPIHEDIEKGRAERAAAKR